MRRVCLGGVSTAEDGRRAALMGRTEVASARSRPLLYDNDDWAFRLMAMLVMVGVVILALGLPALYESLLVGERFDHRTMVLGSVVMRVALLTARSPSATFTCRCSRPSPPHRPRGRGSQARHLPARRHARPFVTVVGFEPIGHRHLAADRRALLGAE